MSTERPMRAKPRSEDQEAARYQWISTPLAAARIGGEPPVSTTHVVRLIEDGELEARDVSRPGSKRPEWRINPTSVDDFLVRRTRGRAA
jgi:hypothetical protein